MTAASHPSGFSDMAELDEFNDAVNTEPEGLEQAELTGAPADGQIDLFTGGTPTVTEYGARHTMVDGETLTVGPLGSVDAAHRAGDANVLRHGGSYEVVERHVTVWQPVTQ